MNFFEIPQLEEEQNNFFDYINQEQKKLSQQREKNRKQEKNKNNQQSQLKKPSKVAKSVNNHFEKDNKKKQKSYSNLFNLICQYLQVKELILSNLTVKDNLNFFNFNQNQQNDTRQSSQYSLKNIDLQQQQIKQDQNQRNQTLFQENLEEKDQNPSLEDLYQSELYWGQKILKIFQWIRKSKKIQEKKRDLEDLKNYITKRKNYCDNNSFR